MADKGIDIPINALVSRFDLKIWTAYNNDFNGRIFRNEVDLDYGTGIRPHVFEGEKDYREVMIDDTFDAVCFFDVMPRMDLQNFTTNVRICFAVNLSTIYGSTERATEHAHDDTYNEILRSRFTPTALIRGSEAFSDYVFNERTNMQPFYVFRYDTEIIFRINEC